MLGICIIMKNICCIPLPVNLQSIITQVWSCFEGSNADWAKINVFPMSVTSKIMISWNINKKHIWICQGIASLPQHISVINQTHLSILCKRGIGIKSSKWQFYKKFYLSDWISLKCYLFTLILNNSLNSTCFTALELFRSYNIMLCSLSIGSQWSQISWNRYKYYVQSQY